MWKCEKCETLNNGEVCIVCGEEKHTPQPRNQPLFEESYIQNEASWEKHQPPKAPVRIKSTMPGSIDTRRLDEEKWQEALRIGTLDAFQAYLDSNHPDKLNSVNAWAKIDELRKEDHVPVIIGICIVAVFIIIGIIALSFSK